MIFSGVKAEELSDVRTEKIEIESLQRKLAALDKGKSSIKNAKKVIELLRFHVATKSLVPVEKKVPAIDYIVKTYDEDIVPLLLDYALSSESKFLKRRAVYCIERISDKRIATYLEETFGDDARGEKFRVLIQSSNDDVLYQIRALGDDENGERGILWCEHVDFFFPRIPEELLELEFELP